jgi:hypothetical protein
MDSFTFVLVRLGLDIVRGEGQPNQRLHPTAASEQLHPLPRLPRGRRG